MHMGNTYAETAVYAAIRNHPYVYREHAKKRLIYQYSKIRISLIFINLKNVILRFLKNNSFFYSKQL